MSFGFRIPAMRRIVFCTLLGVVAWLPLSACLDIDFDDALASKPAFSSQSVRPGEAFFAKDKAYYSDQASHWRAKWQENGKWRDRLRYAVCLALLKKYDEALTHLMAIEAERPGQYGVAISLATVYEQKEDYAQALRWMERALAIDPGGHFGSEWIHLNVLEAEVAGKRHRCTAKELIEQDFGADSVPRSRMDDEVLAQLAASIFYQLDQRVWLHTQPDPYAARLAFELGNLNFLRRFPTVSLLDYALAEEKGLQAPLLAMRIAAVKAGNYKAPPLSPRQKAMERESMQATAKVVHNIIEAGKRFDAKTRQADDRETALFTFGAFFAEKLLIAFILFLAGSSFLTGRKRKTRNSIPPSSEKNGGTFGKTGG